MVNIYKDKSPFYPGQPVPIEFFIGRLQEIKRIERAIKQVVAGKPQSLFLTGEYGIGKSSLASFMRFYAKKNNDILGIHIFLGGVESIDDIAVKTVETVLKSSIYEPTISENVKNFLSKYIGKQDLFGFSINFDALKEDSPDISHGFLPFLHELLNRVKKDGIKGIMLILDEVNGITKHAKFSHFIKGLVDENATSGNTLPLMLMLCGIDERRRDMIQHHQPIERIFDLVEIKPMNNTEMIDFFNNAFNSVGISVDKEAMDTLCHYSAGFPKIMHLIGENIYWINKNTTIDKSVAFEGVVSAAKEVGTKFIDQQVLRSLQSKDYHSILKKISKMNFDLSFTKNYIEKELSPTEKKIFNNFLQKMKKLNVIRSGEVRGEYVFNSRLVRLYLLLNSIDNKK